MSTNFYWVIKSEPTITIELTNGVVVDLSYLICDEIELHPEIHIGKRSSAGPYCRKCRLTLCKAGEAAIHFGISEWYEQCPQCGSYDTSDVCSFSWAQDPQRFKELSNDPAGLIRDEYGDIYTIHEFMDMLG